MPGGEDGGGAREAGRRVPAVSAPLAGLTLTIAREALWLRSDRPMDLLSSGPGGDGVRAGRHIIGLYVDKGYCRDDPERDLAALARRLGIGAAERWVGLMTGVALDEAAVVVRERGGLKVASIVTVGLGNASAAGRDPWDLAERPPPGTINSIVAVGAALTPAGLVNAVVTATEAKALALVERGVRTARGERASGTSSDAIVIAALPPPHEPAGPPLRYAGPATTLGLLIGRAVREAVASRLPPQA